jgi:hypothetical protein
MQLNKATLNLITLRNSTDNSFSANPSFSLSFVVCSIQTNYILSLWPLHHFINAHVCFNRLESTKQKFAQEKEDTKAGIVFAVELLTNHKNYVEERLKNFHLSLQQQWNELQVSSN